jgi:hypothetical protein
MHAQTVCPILALAQSELQILSPQPTGSPPAPGKAPSSSGTSLVSAIRSAGEAFCKLEHWSSSDIEFHLILSHASTNEAICADERKAV